MVKAKVASLLMVLSSVCLGQDLPPSSAPTQTTAENRTDTPSGALARLQKTQLADKGAFVVQDELDLLIDKDGGGACASAAGIDALQTLRVMAGLDGLDNPHKVVLSAFARQPELLKGRVTNEQFTQLLTNYRSLLGKDIAVDIESAPTSTHAADHRGWANPAGPDLTTAPRQLRILSFTVTEADGDVLGRHFVLLKEHAENKVVVVDPHKPSRDFQFILDYKPGGNEAQARVFLLDPEGVRPQPRTTIYELNTVFTLSMRDRELSVPLPAGPGSVEYVRKKLDATADELRGTQDFLNPLVWRKKTASFGLPGLDLPTESGGSAWPASDMVKIFKHAGRQNLNFRDVVGGAHVRPLLRSSNPEVQAIVRQVAQGDAYMAIAITEPDVGSDVQAIKSTSRKVEGGYLISGKKRFNARLSQASHVLIFTQGTTDEQGKLSVFLLPLATPGLKVERFEAHGLTGNSYGGLEFQDLFVPEGRLIGRDGGGLNVFFNHFLYWRLMQVAAAIGTGEQALEQMARRIETRHAFGGPIGRFTHLQQAMGQHWSELRMAESLVQEAANLIDAGRYEQARPLINGLKAEGVEISLRAVDAATRAFGGEGYSTRVDLGDRLRDLNGLRIADGTTDVMRMDVVRQIFGEQFWRMAVETDRR